MRWRPIDQCIPRDKTQPSERMLFKGKSGKVYTGAWQGYSGWYVEQDLIPAGEKLVACAKMPM